MPDFGADWVSQLVTWLVALPAVTGEGFPSLNRYAEQLTSVGFGLLGATFIAGLLQLWAGGLTGTSGAGESLKRAAIAAGALVSYPVVLEAVLVGTNVLTAQMIRHPLVQDGLDKAFGAALIVGAVTGGLSLGLAVGAAIVVLYFVAALIVLKLGLTTALSVAHLSGALVWGVYALPQTAWLARAWSAAVVAAIVVPIAWACVFAAAALLAADTLVFDGGGRHNNALGDALSYLVKPLAAVACFWLAYRAPGFLLGLARSAGLGGVMTGRASLGGGGRAAPVSGGASSTGSGPGELVRRGVQTNADRFRALRHIAGRSVPMPVTATRAAAASSSEVGSRAARDERSPASGAARAVGAAVGPLVRANRWWRELPARGQSLRDGEQAAAGRDARAKPPCHASANRQAADAPIAGARRHGPRPLSGSAAAKPESPRSGRAIPTASPPPRRSGRSTSTGPTTSAPSKAVARARATPSGPTSAPVAAPQTRSRPPARSTTRPAAIPPRTSSPSNAAAAPTPSASRRSSTSAGSRPRPLPDRATPSSPTSSQRPATTARESSDATPLRAVRAPSESPRPPAPSARTKPPSRANAAPRKTQDGEPPRRRP